MIENVNDSKMPSNGEFVEVPKYIGVASINILDINPNNATLKKYGWSIPDDADEPKYVTVTERDGKPVKSARVRFLAQIQDLDSKPVVALDFWVRPEIYVNRDGTKCQIIDAFGQTAWGTKEEVTAKKIPMYSSGPASITLPYKPCHPGEERLIKFLFKYLNITPLQMFDRVRQAYVNSKNPGKLMVDNWALICDGNVSELKEWIKLKPNNCVKVVLGIRTTEDNKAYQTFLDTAYIGNGATPDRNTGEYATARKEIDKFMERNADRPYSFSAMPVQEWGVSATKVEDNSESLFDTSNTVVGDDEEGDLPF